MHRLEVGTWDTPPIGSQLSTVQATLSSTTSGIPAWQPRAGSHVSAPLQTSLSLHRLAVGTWDTPLIGSQLSTVQAIPSSVRSGVPAWQPRTGSQVSAPLQTSLSLHRLAVGAWVTPLTGSQLSTVQATPSSTTSGIPAWQPRTGSQVS